jgi:GDP-mannose 6-dehydrogenase
VVARIYEKVDPKIILTTIEVAEMVKYVDNVWHAAKVTFANEIGRLCKPMAWTATR